MMENTLAFIVFALFITYACIVSNEDHHRKP